MQRIRRVRSPREDLFHKVAGTQAAPLLVQVLGGGTFYNSPFGNDRAPHSAFFPNFPSLAFDTFVTIGIKAANPLVDAMVITPGFPTGITGTQFATTESGWAVTPIDPQSDPFNPIYDAGNGQILFAQFATVDGTGFSGTMLLKFVGNGQSGAAIQSFSYVVPAPGAAGLLGIAALFGGRRRRRR